MCTHHDTANYVKKNRNDLQEALLYRAAWTYFIVFTKATKALRREVGWFEAVLVKKHAS